MVAPKRIGILFVHGIGEQRRFEHLENEARGLVLALQERHGKEAVSVNIRTGLDGERHADQLGWKADGVAPVQILVDKGDKQYAIEFSEVWWADLDERTTLKSRLDFWFWALGQWWEVGRKQDSANLSDLLQDPSQDKTYPWLWIRFQLFFVASVFFSMFVVTILNALLRFIRVPGGIRPYDIFSNYIGDVKLLVQAGRNTKGTLEDLELPPRVSIRRRMVRMLVEMATRDYDRWYIFAHSLGTVVAQNGLNETALCLPNYLDPETWEKANQMGLAKKTRKDSGAKNKVMMPRRPVGLDPRDSIDRSKLFAGLRGVVTYGSPLDKFSALWPWIVGVNQDEVFRDCVWINIYDPTDPVSGALEDFGKPPKKTTNGLTALGPTNISVKASPVLLLSHIRYFTYSKDGENKLAVQTGDWLLDERKGANQAFLKTLSGAESSPSTLKARHGWKLAQWSMVQVSFAMLLGLTLFLGHFPVGEFLGYLQYFIQWVPGTLRPAIDWWFAGTVVSAGTVAMVGFIIRLKRI